MNNVNQLSADELVSLLIQCLTKQGKVKANSNKTPAVVLIPIIKYPDCLKILFTERTQHLKSHSGQISFPGGKLDPSDKSLLDTALRETQEEIGIPREKINILGELNNEDTLALPSFNVKPFVGIINAPLELSLSPNEVASCFEVPIKYLLNRNNYQQQERQLHGKQIEIYSIKYQQHIIWGLTTRILLQLINSLTDCKQH